MTRWLFVGPCLSMLGVLSPQLAARADDARMETASVMVRARGNSGEVRVLPRSVQRSGERPLPHIVNAGRIPRAALQAELASGISRFLRNVRTEPVLAHGKFVGWRLLTLFDHRSEVHVEVLRPGDVVLRINGQSVERPEAFKAVWDSMASAQALVIDIRRDGRPSRVRYEIVP